MLDVKRIQTDGKKVKSKLNYRQREKTAGDVALVCEFCQRNAFKINDIRQEYRYRGICALGAADDPHHVTVSKLRAEFQTPRRRVPTMRSAPYDILKKDVLGYPIWVEAAEDLRKASVRIEELALHSPGEYIVFNQQTSQVVTPLGGSRR